MDAAPALKMKNGGSKVHTRNSYKVEIVWRNAIVMILIHLAGIYGFWIRDEADIKSNIFRRSLTIIAGIGVCGGAHRLWCHRSYKANTIAQLILAFMFTTTYQNSIYTWSRDHRLHHRFSETDADPHNAKRGFFFSHIGWLLVKKHKDVREKGKLIDMTDLELNRIVMFQHRYYYYIMPWIAFLIPTFIPWYFWNESLKVAFFTVTMYRYLIVSHITWCVNSVAHLYGTKPYDRNIGPSENLVTMQINYGEGFHNYHHTYPWDYKASEFGNDWRNVTTLTIDLFAWLGWVTDRKTATPTMIEKKVETSGDGTSRFRNIYDSVVSIKKSFLSNLINVGLFCWFYMYLI